jgi:IS605 OrfB family transposase
MKSNENYSLLPSLVSLQILMMVDNGFKSFFEVLKKKRAGYYHRPCRIPGYLPKDGKFILIFPGAHFKIDYEKQEVRLMIPKKLREKYKSRFFYLPFPKYLSKEQIIKEIRINPVYNGRWFEMLVVYKEIENESLKLQNNDNFLSIDLGVNNLMTCTTNVSNKSFIIDGKYFKSINRYFNKEIGHAKSVVKIVNNKNTSNRIQNLNNKKNNIFTSDFHLISKRLIEYCVFKNITNIYIGLNTGWKNEVNLGKHNNQNFVQIPYSKLISYLKDKGLKYNIKVTTINEAYTSKCNALKLEEMCHHENYSGKRVKRGLFRVESGKVINADVNGSLNIARKCKGEYVNLWIRQIADSGAVLVPMKINVFQLENKFFMNKIL